MSNLRTPPSGPEIVGLNQDDVLLWDVASRSWVPGPVPGGAVTTNDVANESNVTGATATDALNNLQAALPTIRKVASGSTPIAAFDVAVVGPFAINADEAPTVWVYGPTLDANGSSWGDSAKFTWKFVNVDANQVSVRLSNQNGDPVTARWVVWAAQL